MNRVRSLLPTGVWLAGAAQALILTPMAMAQDAPPGPPPDTAAPPAAAKPVPRHAATPVTDVIPRFGMHDTYDRFVLNWTEPVHATASVKSGVATIGFDRRARLDGAALNQVLPATMKPVKLSPDGTALTFRVPGERRLHCHTRGNLVIIDLVKPGAQPPDPEGPAAASAPQAAKATSVEPTATPAPAAPPQAEPSTPLAPLPDPVLIADTADLQLTIRSTPIDDGVSLRFEWNAPTKAAVFQLQNTVWIVFDRPVTIQKQPPAKDGSTPNLVQVANASATLLHLPSTLASRLVIGRAGNSWLVDIRHRGGTTAEPGGAQIVSDKAGLYAIANPGSPVTLADPDSGEVLIAIPVDMPGAHFAANADLKSYHVLPTSQGMLFRPESDTIRITIEADGVRVTDAQAPTLDIGR